MIGLLVDTSCSQIRVLESERTASYKFLDQVLHGDDVAFVLHFDFRVSLLQGFTSSREKLAAAFSALSPPMHCDTHLYDAIHDASEQLMKKESGRKAFVLLSDGGDVRSKCSIVTAIEFAQRADTIITQCSSRIGKERRRPECTSRAAERRCCGLLKKPAADISLFQKRARLKKSTLRSRKN